MKPASQILLLLLYLKIMELVSGAVNLNSTWWVKPVSFLFPVPSKVNQLCKNHVIEYQSNIKNQSPWALQMMDASGRLQSGVLSSHIRSFGNFDQCLAVKNPLQKFVGKYCLLRLDFGTHSDGVTYDWVVREMFHYYSIERYSGKSPNRTYFPTFLSGKWALCLPSSCSADDINILAKTILTRATNNLNLNVSILLDEKDCSTASSERPYGTSEYFAIPVFSITLLMIVVSTLITFFIKKDDYKLLHSAQIIAYCFLDESNLLYFQDERRSVPMKLACSFSLIDNWNQWLELKSSRSLKFLEGIRALSALNIILIHQRYKLFVMPYFNLETIMQSTYNHTYTPLWFSLGTVDVFVLLSGLLRYLRLTPTYLFVILFYMAFFDRIDNGPEWYYDVSVFGEFCRKGWWQNLLYINNYCVNQCINTSWYMGMDMQLFLLAPLLIYPLWKWHILGKTIMIFAMIVSLVVPIAVLYSINFVGEQMLYTGSPPTHMLFMKKYYNKTHARMSPYFVGIVMGFVLRNSESITIRKWMQKVCWATCILVMLIYVYFPLTLADEAQTFWEKFQTAMYYSVGRLIFSLGIAWIIYACNMSNDGIIKRFLSCNTFAYLGKISYCMYIIHHGILFYNIGITQTTVQAHPFIVIRNLAGDYVMILFFSFVLHVAVESSFANIGEMFFVNTKNKNVKKDC